MELTLDQALEKGIEAHKAGKAQEADRYYTAILKADPKHPDANHNMGVLAVGVGKVQEALPFFKAALEANPSVAQYWLSYIDALIKLDRIADAKAVFDQAKSNGAKGNGFDGLEKRLEVVELSPNMPLSVQEPPAGLIQSLINLYTQGRYQEALNKTSQLLQQFSRSATLYNILGTVTKGLGKLDEAIEAYNKAISIKPDYSNAFTNMGVVLKDQGKLDEAIEAYKKAIVVNPDSAPTHNNMGVVFKEQGKLEEAIEAFNKALSIKPDYPEAYNNSTELLKMYSPKIESSSSLIEIDGKIKNLSSKMLHATSNTEIVNYLSEGLSYILTDSFYYKTSLSQIYRRNTVDLNCKRHQKIFKTNNVIPEFCFGCFKVQVEVTTVIDLVKVTALFYKFDFEEDLTKKTFIELRPNIPGYYKGLIYCNSLEQAKVVKNVLDISLKEVFGKETVSKIKEDVQNIH